MARPASRKTTSQKKTTTRKSSKPTPRKTTRAASTRSAPKKTSQAKPHIQISPERKLDIFGIGLMLFGILTLLSFFTARTGMLTVWWTATLTKAIGLGGYALPVLLIVFGLWLLMRNIEKLPMVSFERVLGLILGFVNLLLWFELISRSRFVSGTVSLGGGTLGRWILDLLIHWLGKPGAIIAISAWLLTSLILLLDLSMSDLSVWTGKKLKTLQHKFVDLAKSLQKRSQAGHKQEQIRKTAQPDRTVLENNVTQPKQPEPVANLAKPAVTQIENKPRKTWILPHPEEILAPIVKVSVDEENDQHRARVIEETLRSFSTPAHVVEIKRGPSITLFGVEPDFIESRNGRTRVRVSNIVRLADDIAMALKASRIRIQAPVPGKGYVGIEVPNQQIAMVSLLEIIQSTTFSTMEAPLRFALGKDVSGNPAAADLASMPHLLIAGTTNSGKSVCINAILACYLMNLTPDQLRVLMVDPKRVELTGYNGIPHLLAPVIVDAEKVVGALQWMMREMDLRYHMFSETGTRNIVEYNTKQSAKREKILPYLLVVIDELADLMMLAPDETERSLTRLAQLARATGIHLILATQRPSTDILTGLIKANFPARIAFAVASGVDSRVILDQPGAERLLGRGDMLFQAPDAAAPVRLQGTFVSDAELNRLTSFWRLQSVEETAPERPDQAVFTAQPHLPLKQETIWQEMQKDPDEDPVTKEALAIIRQEGRASISMLQRKLRIGYTRAARLIESLETQGIIGPPDPQTQVREVLDYGKGSPPAQD